jgi:hypothetical protein
MEKLLNAEIVGQIKDIFTQMKEPVQILHFGSESPATITPTPANYLRK